MKASVSVSLTDFVNDTYVYYLTTDIYLRIIRMDEDVLYNSMEVPLSGFCMEFVDASGSTETHTNQPVVIGIAGSVCTITPVSDTSLNGEPLSDDNIESVTFELSYGE